MLIQTLLFTLIPATLVLSLIFGISFCKLIKFFQKPKDVVFGEMKEEQNLSKGASELEVVTNKENSSTNDSQIKKISVYNKIMEKATIEAQEIKTKGAKKAEQITDKVIQETKTKISQLMQEAREKNNDLIKTKNAELEQKSKQQVLSKQKDIIKATTNVALERLLALDDDTLKNLVVSYIQKSSLDSDILIKVNEKDYSKYQKLFSSQSNSNLDLLAELISSKYLITLSNERAEIEGGFIVIGKYYDLDYSFETILDSLEEQLITEVSEILFKSEE